MPRPRGTQQSLIISGLKDKRPGYYNQRNWETGTVLPEDIAIEPPRGRYCKDTREAWKAITGNLIAMHTLAEQDIPTMTVMFDALDRYFRIKEQLDLLDTTPDWSNEKWTKNRSTVSKMMNQELDMFTRLACRYGLTPTERSRLVSEPTEAKDVDPLDIILGEE